MQWTVSLSETALKTLEKINKPKQLRIRQFIKDTLASLDNPRASGKALQGNLKGLWRYRVGDYRLVCLSFRRGRHQAVLFGSKEYQQKMDAAHQGLESRFKSIYHPVRG